jgi:hypothetical protein
LEENIPRRELNTLHLFVESLSQDNYTNNVNTKEKMQEGMQMKRFCSSLFVFTLYFSMLPYPPSDIGYTQGEEVPSYAKWGRLAILRTKEKYPKADIIDYLYIGRRKKTNDIAMEQFKLWLRESGREFGVFINIEFDTKTENILSITFKETSR